MTALQEVADRVWVARHEWFDVNVTVVGGSRGLLVVDTHASEAAAQGYVAAIRQLGAGPVVAVVNTHEHFDHTFGNAVLRDADAALPIYAHHVAAERTVAAGERIKAAYAADPDDEHAVEVGATRIVPADHLVTAAVTIDLGDRGVELLHVGRGHTAGDLVVRVPAADVLMAGDLVEEGAPPVYGADSHPLDWPATLDAVAHHLTERTVVIPGHGALVDRAFVRRQQADVAAVATAIRDLVRGGVAVADAVGSGTWPFDPAVLGHAVQRGYDQLRAVGA